jgi:hypothetical protein
MFSMEQLWREAIKKLVKEPVIKLLMLVDHKLVAL